MRGSAIASGGTSAGSVSSSCGSPDPVQPTIWLSDRTSRVRVADARVVPVAGQPDAEASTGTRADAVGADPAARATAAEAAAAPNAESLAAKRMRSNLKTQT